MANSPSDLPARIKSAVQIPALLELFGLTPNRQGFLRCPFHDGDSTPSLKVYPGGRGWYCFGCHRGGDVISLAMELYRTDYKGAVNRLNREFHLCLGRSSGDEFQRLRTGMSIYERRRQQAEAEEQYELDWLEWAQCNQFIRTWPYFLNPWPWVWAIQRRDYLAHRMEAYERGGDAHSCGTTQKRIS